jgi:hypothetical protein
MRNLQRGPRVFAPGTLIRKLRLQWGPSRVKMAAVASDWRVLAGGEGLAEGKRVLHDLQDVVHMLVGHGHEERRRSKVDGEEWRQLWRRLWRRVHVSDEGPANMEGWSTHEHRGVVGMLFRYLIRLKVGQKGVVNVEVARVFIGGDGGTVFWWLGCRRAVKE